MKDFFDQPAYSKDKPHIYEVESVTIQRRKRVCGKHYLQKK